MTRRMAARERASEEADGRTGGCERAGGRIVGLKTVVREKPASDSAATRMEFQRSANGKRESLFDFVSVARVSTTLFPFSIRTCTHFK